MTRKTNEERFWSKVNKNGSLPIGLEHLGPCWVWTAYTQPNGYAQFRVGQGRIYVHRFSFELRNGAIPNDSLDVDHICSCRNCVNPEHLRLVTHRDNQKYRKVNKDSLTGFKGVTFDPRRNAYYAVIYIPEHKYLGQYRSPEKAHEAYCEAAKLYFGEFAHDGINSLVVTHV